MRNSKILLKLAIGYGIVLVAILLWPFDFIFFAKNGSYWIKTSYGIFFKAKGQVLSPKPATFLFDRILNGSGLTVEIWASTKEIDQTGPARIFSYSLNNSLRNFTLGQSKGNLIVRLRTNENDLNGVKHSAKVKGVFESPGLKHIVVTYDYMSLCVYVNNEKIRVAESPRGRFDNWDPSYYLVIGNEAVGDRPWIGKIFFTAIYNRPLNGYEIKKRYNEGPLVSLQEKREKNSKLQGTVALYKFHKQNGRVVYDESGNSPPTNLYIPKSIQNVNKPFLEFSIKSFRENPLDVFNNIIAFVILGFLMHAAIISRFGNIPFGYILAMVFLVLFFSISIEIFQYFIIARHSSLVDSLNNTIGAVIGIAIKKKGV